VFVAQRLGAPAPQPLDEASARSRFGDLQVFFMNAQRGAGNAKARRELGWVPREPDWRAALEALYPMA
jgi:hypothetical protein